MGKATPLPSIPSARVATKATPLATNTPGGIIPPPLDKGSLLADLTAAHAAGKGALLNLTDSVNTVNADLAAIHAQGKGALLNLTNELAAKAKAARDALLNATADLKAELAANSRAMQVGLGTGVAWGVWIRKAARDPLLKDTADLKADMMACKAALANPVLC